MTKNEGNDCYLRILEVTRVLGSHNADFYPYSGGHKIWDVYFPDSLLEIAGNAVNKLPKPLSWSWSVSNVMDWVKYGLRLPQYVIIFQTYNIDGKKLIFLNCQTLPFMNITDFDHIKYISKNVRRLYGLPPDTVNGHRRRSVHDVYGRYYTHLATGTAAGTLFDYMLSVGAVSRPRRKPSGCPFDRQSPPPDATMLARPWAGRCGLADTAVAHLRAERTGMTCERDRTSAPDARSIPDRSVFRNGSGVKSE